MDLEAIDPEVEADYESFWKDLLEVDGAVDMRLVKNELCDYHIILDNVSKVYYEITGYRISKPNTTADAVLGEYQEHVERQIAEALAEQSAELERLRSLARRIADVAHMPADLLRELRTALES